jgi:hypothetical protein
MFQTKVVEKIKTHILCSITFFPKIVPFMRYVEKYGTASQATDDNIIRRMRFAYWITKATDTVKICNTYCVSTTTVTRTRLNVTLHVHCLSGIRPSVKLSGMSAPNILYIPGHHTLFS